RSAIRRAAQHRKRLGVLASLEMYPAVGVQQVAIAGRGKSRGQVPRTVQARPVVFVGHEQEREVVRDTRGVRIAPVRSLVKRNRIIRAAAGFVQNSEVV